MVDLARIKRLIPDLDPARVAEHMARNAGRLETLSMAEFEAEARKAASRIDEEGVQP